MCLIAFQWEIIIVRDTDREMVQKGREGKGGGAFIPTERA